MATQQDPCLEWMIARFALAARHAGGGPPHAQAAQRASTLLVHQTTALSVQGQSGVVVLLPVQTALQATSMQATMMAAAFAVVSHAVAVRTRAPHARSQRTTMTQSQMTARAAETVSGALIASSTECRVLPSATLEMILCLRGFGKAKSVVDLMETAVAGVLFAARFHQVGQNFRQRACTALVVSVVWTPPDLRISRTTAHCMLDIHIHQFGEH